MTPKWQARCALLYGTDAAPKRTVQKWLIRRFLGVFSNSKFLKAQRKQFNFLAVDNFVRTLGYMQANGQGEDKECEYILEVTPPER
ncbi:hypothetical protein TNCV_3682461 [Trichonephila clavipes]|uniref:Uncharacterized protein n=1 Tax=Trichonephila clavipes TaxID=2585209 RepID=A0A8X6RCP1_TRICX|nr:hypothetical protein TNCV_3682461 [Trichonephila clavipes]